PKQTRKITQSFSNNFGDALVLGSCKKLGPSDSCF
nr:hypothetical protein [Tanacetum cinerariifolium]